MSTNKNWKEASDAIKHFNENKYIIICEAVNLDDDSEVVVYKIRDGTDTFFVRNKEEFYRHINKEQSLAL